MIKSVLIFVVVVIFSQWADGQTYTNKYDNIDLNQILRSDRLLRNYVNCLLDSGRCTPDGMELKKALPDALRNGCSSCTERQRNGAKTVLHYLIDNKRSWWNELERKYDPTGEYRRRYETEASREGIRL